MVRELKASVDEDKMGKIRFDGVPSFLFVLLDFVVE